MKCNEPRTTCPSREEFAKELFNSLGGCIIKETTGHTIYDRWVCAKFGKDNNGMEEVFKRMEYILYTKETLLGSIHSHLTSGASFDNKEYFNDLPIIKVFAGR